MAGFLILQCPVCGRQRPLLVTDVSAERLIEGLAVHLHARHPKTLPADVERLISDATEQCK